jgi:hypothetical protein
MTTPGNPPESPEEKREGGSVLAIVGVILWFFDALVIFFMPAGLKLGYRTAFLAITIALGVLGLVLIILGARSRRAA